MPKISCFKRRHREHTSYVLRNIVVYSNTAIRMNLAGAKTNIKLVRIIFFYNERRKITVKVDSNFGPNKKRFWISSFAKFSMGIRVLPTLAVRQSPSTPSATRMRGWRFSGRRWRQSPSPTTTRHAARPTPCGSAYKSSSRPRFYYRFTII